MSEGLPVRLQLSRRIGFNLQRHSLRINGLPAKVCTRPGRWGNRYRVGAVTMLDGVPVPIDARLAAELHARHLAELAPEVREALVAPLRGYNLACFCPLHEPCHVDNWLRLACADGVGK